MKQYLIVFIVFTTVIIPSSDGRKNGAPMRKATFPVPKPTTTIETAMNASWTWANPIFRHQYGEWSYYYDVFKVVVPVAGDYRFTTRGNITSYGYLYLPSFNATSPGQNLVGYGIAVREEEQFEFTKYLDRSVPYYLVVTTFKFLEIGEYQVVVSGSARATLTRSTVFESAVANITIYSAFTHLQPVYKAACDPSTFFSYDIFSIVPRVDGNFTVAAVFAYGANVQLYSSSFDPLATEFNLADKKKTSAYGTLTRLDVGLLASNRYYLIISSFYYHILGNYRMTFYGSSNFNLTKTTSMFTYTVKTSSSLTTSSQQYSRGNTADFTYYYKVFRITVRRLGIYSFLGYSSVDLFAFLHENRFSPMVYYPNVNIGNYYSDSQAKIVIKSELMPDKTYYWVVTTLNEDVTGAFNLTAVGPQPFNVTAVPDSSTSTVTLSSSLTTQSRQFRRCFFGSYDTYYYRLFNITVPSLGLYTIKTVGVMDTFGCLYISRFDPTNSDSNLFSYDDQSGANNQFAITTIFNTNTAYYLAASTNRKDSVGSFKVTASGPAKMNIRAVDNA